MLEKYKSKEVRKQFMDVKRELMKLEQPPNLKKSFQAADWRGGNSNSWVGLGARKKESSKEEGVKSESTKKMKKKERNLIHTRKKRNETLICAKKTPG